MNPLAAVLNNLIRSKKIDVCFGILLPEESFHDDLAAIDKMKEVLTDKIRTIFFDLDDHAISKNLEILGLIVLVYGLHWKQPDSKHIYSRLCEAAYKDRLNLFITQIVGEDPSRRERVLSRHAEFFNITEAQGKTPANWFKLAAKLISREMVNQKIISSEAIEIFPKQESVDLISKEEIYSIIKRTLSNTKFVRSEYRPINAKQKPLQKLINENNDIIVTGGPGSGKTTWINNLQASLSELNLNTQCIGVYINLKICASRFHSGLSVFEILFEEYFSKHLDVKYQILALLKELAESGELVLFADDLTVAHYFVEEDIAIRNGPVIFEDQRRILDAISIFAKKVLVVSNWQVDLVAEVFQPAKIINLDGHLPCRKVAFERELASRLSNFHENIRGFYSVRYELLTRDYYGLNSCLQALKIFHHEEHLRAGNYYLAEMARINSFFYNDMEISSHEFAENSFMLFINEFIHQLVGNIEKGDFDNNSLFCISASGLFPIRDSVKSKILFQILNSNLFDLGWINGFLYLKFANEGLLAILLSRLGRARLERVANIFQKNNIDSSILHSAISFTRPFTLEDRKRGGDVWRISGPYLLPPDDPCEFDW